MRRFVVYCIAFILIGLCHFPVSAQLTLDSCIAMAESNYPLIRKYGIVEKISAIELSEVDKSWLPQATIYAQGSIQNAVPQFPDALRSVLQQMGQEFQGLGKVQYKIGVDLNQTVWDGGTSKVRRESVRANLAEQQAMLDVEMYAIRDRVESIYFALLLVQQQAMQIKTTLNLLDSNLQEIQAMKRNGVAMQSDVDMIEAQRLAVGQQLATVEGNASIYRGLLDIFLGKSTGQTTLLLPPGDMPETLESQRPELHLFDTQKLCNDTRLGSVKASLMPRIGLFAQAYYGYPGLDYFASMRNRNLSFNVLAGVKVSWNVGALYTRKNDISHIALSNEKINIERDRFEFETHLASSQQLSEIKTMRNVMADDNRIVTLRGKVRQAAESQLRNGVIDATALLSKITDEQQAKLTASYHEIQLLKLIYKLRNTLNL